jgi:hypothetical protein
MKNSQFIPRAASAFVLALAVALAAVPASAHRNDGPSAVSTLSALPVASVASATVAGVGASVGTVALPAALSTTGASLVIRSVEVTARGTLCVLERVSDGAVASIEIAGRSVERGSLAAGRAVEVSVVGAGVVLSAMGEVIAIIPGELGRTLLHNERITY